MSAKGLGSKLQQDRNPGSSGKDGEGTDEQCGNGSIRLDLGM